MLIHGVPYSETALFSTEKGGTPYGATHVAGNDSNQPLTEDELIICHSQGKRLATLALKLALKLAGENS